MSKLSKAPVPVGKCHGCGATILGKFALKSHACKAPRISRGDLGLQRKGAR